MTPNFHKRLDALLTKTITRKTHHRFVTKVREEVKAEIEDIVMEEVRRLTAFNGLVATDPDDDTGLSNPHIEINYPPKARQVLRSEEE